MRQPLALIASPVTWVAVFFVALLLGMPQLQPVFEWGFPGVTPPVYEREKPIEQISGAKASLRSA